MDRIKHSAAAGMQLLGEGMIKGANYFTSEPAGSLSSDSGHNYQDKYKSGTQDPHKSSRNKDQQPQYKPHHEVPHDAYKSHSTSNNNRDHAYSPAQVAYPAAPPPPPPGFQYGTVSPGVSKSPRHDDVRRSHNVPSTTSYQDQSRYKQSVNQSVPVASYKVHEPPVQKSNRKQQAVPDYSKMIDSAHFRESRRDAKPKQSAHLSPSFGSNGRKYPTADVQEDFANLLSSHAVDSPKASSTGTKTVVLT